MKEFPKLTEKTMLEAIKNVLMRRPYVQIVVDTESNNFINLSDCELTHTQYIHNLV